MFCAIISIGLPASEPRAAETATGGMVQASGAAPASGIDLKFIDDSVRAQDNLYLHTNGKWLAATDIPADKASYGVFDQLEDESREQLRTIVERLQTRVDPADPDQRKIADLYASFMDEDGVEKAGLAPLQSELARIEAISSKRALAGLIAHFNRIGVEAPYTPQIHLDAHDSTKYVFDIAQDGLGMPDRDYYLNHDTALRKTRAQYLQHVERMLALAGDPHAAGSARDILRLETALAKAQWTKVRNRDPQQAYNKVPVAKLALLARSYDWTTYLAQSGIDGKVDYLVVSQPSYITDFNKLLQSMTLDQWKAYFRWHLLSNTAPFLGKAFVDEHFAFYGHALRGVEQDEARWKRGIRLTDALIGEGLGRLYVAEYFPPEHKARMESLVRNLLAAYRADIDTLAWMGPATRGKAQAKLASFTTKIGYPEHWRDYASLQIARDDLLGNVLRGRNFDYQRNILKLGKPVDRTEWDMTPPTVNAYYNPEKNEIVFPAGILRSPFFNATADDAANYGAIGGVIGHEISHGFDDQGSQYDGAGKLLKPPGWFTRSDLASFMRRSKALVAQYAAYAPVPGYPINGELTLGENIADNSGLAIAYKAYRLSLGNTAAAVIDGMTGDQRVFLGWAQAWRAKTRDSQAILEIKADPHSPEQFRGLVPEMNQAAFYEAFGVKPGDKMYLAPERRVTLW
jgi:predicted metalloendopeptidase